MPIDINAILTTFMAQTQRNWKVITDAMESIAKQVSDRLDRANSLERATRNFSELAFEYGAVVLTVASSQAGALGQATPQSLWPSSIRQELLLPRIFITLRRITDSIRDSVARFQIPRPEMFSGRGTRFVDIFGQLGMLVHAFAIDYRPVRLLEQTARDAMSFYRSRFGNAPGPAAASSSDTSVGPSTSALELIPAQIAGALIVIPAFFNWMSALFRFFDLAIRLEILNQFERIQQRVYRLRQEILTKLFETLRGTGQSVMELLFAVEHILLRSVVYWTRFASVYLLMLGHQLSKLSAFLAKWVNLALAVLHALAAVFDPLMHLPLPGGLTLGDLVDYVSGTAENWILKKLDALELASRGTRIHDFVEVYRALLRAASNPPAAVMPHVPRLPDLYRVAIAPYEHRLFDLLATLRGAFVPGVQNALYAGANALISMANVAEQSAHNTAINPATWNSILSSAIGITSSLFAGQNPTVRTDALAAAYERDAVIGGLATVSEVIPRYIGGVIDWWRRRTHPAGTDAVSPHILSRRARFTRVRVPRMSLRVAGFDLDNLNSNDPHSRSSLLATLQNRFKAEVERAWATGELQVAHI